MCLYHLFPDKFPVNDTRGKIIHAMRNSFRHFLVSGPESSQTPTIYLFRFPDHFDRNGLFSMLGRSKQLSDFTT